MVMETSAILVVDDEASVTEALKRSFIDDPVYIHTADSGMAGLTILAAHKIKVVVSDEMMPGISVAEFLTRVSSRFPHVIRIILTGHARLNAAIKEINKGESHRFFTNHWDDF